jgi:recombination protein RecR
MSRDYVVADLVNTFQRLPSIGYRAAKKITLQILQRRDELMKPLLNALGEAYQKVKRCRVCDNFGTEELCEICANPRRDRQVVCVVENVADLWALESINIFSGTYHVLDGTLSALEGRGFEVLKIDRLRERIRADNVQEVVLATNATSDGQTTAFYIAEQLSGYGLKLSQLALGVPMGSELSYLDDSTLNIAFKNKKDF